MLLPDGQLAPLLRKSAAAAAVSISPLLAGRYLGLKERRGRRVVHKNRQLQGGTEQGNPEGTHHSMMKCKQAVTALGILESSQDTETVHINVECL